jgi:hypothetical protein
MPNDAPENDIEACNQVNTDISGGQRRNRRISSTHELVSKTTAAMLKSVDEDFKFDRVENSIDNLDYYMYFSYTSIFPNNITTGAEDSKKQWRRSIVSVLRGGARMLLCVIIQTIVTPMMIYYSFESNNDMCMKSNNIYQKITAAIFTFYINISSINSLYDQLIIYSYFDSFFILYHKFRHKHFKIKNNHQRQIFNALINFYLTINIISCVLTTFGSVIIIYNSSSILDIILNSLALKFIDEIDNMSISKSEIYSFKLIYNDIKEQINENMTYFNSHVPKKISQVIKLVKKMCLMYCIGLFLSIILYIFTIFAEIWIIMCY